MKTSKEKEKLSESIKGETLDKYMDNYIEIVKESINQHKVEVETIN